MMKKPLNLRFGTILFTLLISGTQACNTGKKTDKTLAMNAEKETDQPIQKNTKRPLSKEFKEYWYAGDAEITSYELEQARYGELRKGSSVLIYVTEPFLPELQVKADRPSTTNVPVLKLNKTKKYLTGIYHYSIMSCTFYPVHDNQHALKSSLSVQEWCGHVYAQLNNREKFEFTSHSYFEGEADEKLTFEKAHLENELWNRIRIHPEGLPQGDISIVPSLEYFRVQHRPVQPYAAKASLSSENGINTYMVEYTETNRKLSIQFESDFPYQILGWEEEFQSGYGP